LTKQKRENMGNRYNTCQNARKKGICNPRVIEIRSFKKSPPLGFTQPREFEPDATYEIEVICEKCNKFVKKP